MTRTVRYWELRRENQDSIIVTDTHGDRGCDVVVRFEGKIMYPYPERIPDYVKKAVVTLFKAHYDCLVGFFSEDGYNVWRQIDGKLPGDDALYTAGNSPYDSTITMNPDDPDCESLETLKGYCEQTGKDMAEELGIPWGGCSQEDSSYADF